jgi:hypothetical protein
MAWTKEMIESTGKIRMMHFRDFILRVDKARADKGREAREASRECPFCFYVMVVMAGQAFTEFDCGSCEGKFSHHNTRVPRLCDGCADSLEACVRCGGSRTWTVDEALAEGPK